MSAKTLYEILQVDPEASTEVIKAAYKSLATKYHPDRDKSADAAQRFAEIQNAFNILSEPDRRRQYDADVARGLNNTAATSGSTVVLRVDGTSTFLTLDEHHRRRWQEAAACDLSNHDFSGVSFKDAKLAKAKLDGGRFNGCDFRGADLTDCSANACQFDKADFAGAKLFRTDFSSSKIRGAKFFALGPIRHSSCKVPTERFTDEDPTIQRVSKPEEAEILADLRHVNFSNCDLSGTQFGSRQHENEQSASSTSGKGTVSEKAIWVRHWMLGSKIAKCDFSGAMMIDCELKDIDFTESVFLRANLQQAQMQGCNVGGVDLASCNVINTDLTRCIVNDETKFPVGYAMPKDAKNSSEEKRQLRREQESENVFLGTVAVLGIVVLFLVFLFVFLISR